MKDPRDSEAPVAGQKLSVTAVECNVIIGKARPISVSVVILPKKTLTIPSL